MVFDARDGAEKPGEVKLCWLFEGCDCGALQVLALLKSYSDSARCDKFDRNAF